MIKQPKTIRFGGRVYRRVQEFRQILGPISEGPFYSTPGVDPADWAFMPDVGYLVGATRIPTFMHCIQQSTAPSTPRPNP